MLPINLPHDHGQGLAHQLEEIPLSEDFQIVSSLFKLLSDTSRIRIFWFLCHCEECVINISAFMDMTSPAVAHHLKQLRENNLIESRRDGKEVYYKAAKTTQAEALHQMIEELMDIACPKTNKQDILP